MVDLETSLENISRIETRGGEFHKAMIARANQARGRVDAVLAATSIPEIQSGLAKVTANIDEGATVDAATPMALGDATKAFLGNHDGTGLSAIDGLIPTETKGNPY
jgi:hypothetical protein